MAGPGIEPGTSGSEVRCATDCTTRPGVHGVRICDDVCYHLQNFVIGPVVQSIGSITNSSVQEALSLTVITNLNVIVFAKKL